MPTPEASALDSCDLCGSDRAEVLLQLRTARTDRTVTVCTRCGMVAQRPREVGHDAGGSAAAARLAGQDPHGDAEMVAPQLARASWVLDTAAGDGQFVERAAEANPQAKVVAIGLRPDRIAHFERHPQVTVVPEDVEAAWFPPASFDVIRDVDGLTYAPSATARAVGYHRLLDPNGVAVLGVRHLTAITAMEEPGQFFDDIANHHLSAHTFTQVLKRAGLAIDRIEIDVRRLRTVVTKGIPTAAEVPGDHGEVAWVRKTLRACFTDTSLGLDQVIRTLDLAATIDATDAATDAATVADGAGRR